MKPKGGAEWADQVECADHGPHGLVAIPLPCYVLVLPKCAAFASLVLALSSAGDMTKSTTAPLD